MERKHSAAKNRRKLISPIFHTQSKKEDERHLSKEIIKVVRKTGILNLSGKHLASVPDRMFSIYDLTDENAANLDFNKPSKEEDMWWNLKPLTNLDLSSNVLTELPGQIGTFQDLTIINLQDNSLISLPQEITSLTKLTKLVLNHNKINGLPKDIDRLRELRVLSVSHNCLDQLPDTLVDLVMLEKLDLSNNEIENLPSGIGYLVRLMELNVANNKLKDLPPDIVNLRSLGKLEINHNSIKHLPESLGELRKLHMLYAQHNDIEEMPDFTGCDSIQEIYFGNNFIKEIPLDLCENLVHLKILELRDNQIKVLPPEIAKMMQLAKLDFTNNDLTEIPAAIGLLPHLQSFKIEGNKLKQIRPDIIHTGTQRILQFLREKLKEDDVEPLTNSIANVPFDACVFPDRYKMRNGNILNLTMKTISCVPEEVFLEAKEARVSVVDLCKNKLLQVPTGLQMLSDYLTELNLAGNQIKEIPKFVAGFAKLKFLDLSKNMLSDLPQELGDLTNLRELVLFNNRFTKIPNCIFGMVGLEILILNDNSLDEINMEGLKHLNRLATLNLSNNNIHVVPPDLGNMTHLRTRTNSSQNIPRHLIMSENDDSDTELDPRIQIELEKLNTTTDEINKLEIEYDEANTTFRMLLNESTRRLKLLTKKLGSCIEKARPYNDLLEIARKQQKECQEAALQYQKANGIHAAAKETVALAEQRFLSNQHEWQFDNAWQEMLNHATMKVMEAETQKAERGRDHQIKASIYKETEENMKQLEEKLQKFIIKSRPYFDEKALCQEQLNTQKQRIESIKHEIVKTKNFYSQTLKNLEKISNEIHMKRQGKQTEDDLLTRPREPGVGAELNPSFEETPTRRPKHMSSLPDITAELDRCEICSVATTSSAVSEKDPHENMYADLEEVKAILRDMNIRPDNAEGKIDDIYISELHIGNICSPSKSSKIIEPEQDEILDTKVGNSLALNASQKPQKPVVEQKE